MMIVAQLTIEMATMASNMRNINNQNIAMQELLMQMQSQGDYPIPHFAPQEQYPQEDEVQSQEAPSSRHARRGSPLKEK